MRACGAYTVRWRKLADFAVFWKRSNRAQCTGSIQNTLLLLRHMLYQLDNIAHSHTNTFTSMEHCVLTLMVSLRTNIHNKFSFRKTTTYPTHIWFCVYEDVELFLESCWMLISNTFHFIIPLHLPSDVAFIGLVYDSPRMSITIHILIQSTLHREPNQLPKLKLPIRNKNSVKTLPYFGLSYFFNSSI